jgi:hypothetical protein
MLFKQDTLKRIATGEITLEFRRWQRPSVKTGELLTPIGPLAIRAGSESDDGRISMCDVHRTGGRRR